MTEFASHLGLRQSAISRYESDKLTPSSSVLLNLYRLAHKSQHKIAIRALLGESAAVLEKEDRFEAEAARLATSLDAIIGDLKKGPEAARRFSQLAIDVVSDPEGIPLWLCELIQMWFRVRHDPQGRREFDDLVHRAVMKIGNLQSQLSAGSQNK